MNVKSFAWAAAAEAAALARHDHWRAHHGFWNFLLIALPDVVIALRHWSSLVLGLRPEEGVVARLTNVQSREDNRVEW